MKRKYSIIFMLLLAVITANAQEAKPAKKAEPLKQNAIKINPISPFWDAVQLSYLRRTSDDVAFNFSLGYMNYTPSNDFRTYANENTVAVFIAPEIRYYLENKHVENFYVSGFARYINMTYSGDVTIATPAPFTMIYTLEHREAVYNSLGIGILAGKEFIYKNRIILDGFVGPVYSFLLTQQDGFPKGTGNNNTTNTDLSIAQMFSNNMLRRYGIRAGFTIGYMF